MRYTISALVAIFVTLLASCSTNVPIPESNVSLLRIKLKQLQLIEPSTNPNVERVKYTEIARQASDISAYNVAATANTMLGKYYENLSLTSKGELKTEFLNHALEAYQKALFYDKKEQDLVESVANPFPNADKIAISLNNISFVQEKLGDIDKAILYAERAYKINVNLDLLRRVIKDCERLSSLYTKIGKKSISKEYKQTQQEYEIRLAKQNLMNEPKD